jgi:hypothetical protein
MKPTLARADKLSAALIRGGTETRPLWPRIAQAVFAVFFLVAAAQAGLPTGDTTLLFGTAADKATRADAFLDQSRKLLRPKAVPAVERVWRAIHEGGSGSDQEAALAVLPRQEPLLLAHDQIGLRSNDERGPAWRTIRAGYARAPPVTSDRSQAFA